VEKITKELMELAQKANSPEEILALAKENNVEMDAEVAQVPLDSLNNTELIPDEALEDVAGGNRSYSKSKITFTCTRCGSTNFFIDSYQKVEGSSESEGIYVCSICKKMFRSRDGKELRELI